MVCVCVCMCVCFVSSTQQAIATAVMSSLCRTGLKELIYLEA